METDQLGWTEAQWNRVREEVFNAWQRVRVAGSFLPEDRSLPANTVVVPSEVFDENGLIDDQATANLLEISLEVRLSRQQVRDEDLSSALLLFTRRARQIAQLEDWYIFNGIVADAAFPAAPPPANYAPGVPFVQNMGFIQGLPTPIDRAVQIQGLRRWNPGALGLFYSSDDAARNARGAADGPTLITRVVDAISSLEEQGYVGPYVCVFARTPYTAAHAPEPGSLVMPRDRLEPLIGRSLLHASALDLAPAGVAAADVAGWRRRGVLLSLAGDAIDLAVAAEARPEFRSIAADGRYVFAVFERFALRVKDRNAIVPLQFEP